MRKGLIVGLSVLLMLTLWPVSAWAQENQAKTLLQETVEPLIGTPYRYGGTTTSGFDCSGFTSYVFGLMGIELHRSSRDQATQGTKVAKDELRPGDLVFFNTFGNSISHVGIYLGNNKFIHSSTNRGVVINDLSESYYARTYVTARRVMSEEVYQKWAVLPEQNAVTSSNADKPNPPANAAVKQESVSVETPAKPANPEDTLISRMASSLLEDPNLE